MSADATRPERIASLKRLLAEVVGERDAARAALQRMVNERKQVDEWLPEASLASSPDAPLTLIERAVATYTFVCLCNRALPEPVLRLLAVEMHRVLLAFRAEEREKA